MTNRELQTLARPFVERSRRDPGGQRRDRFTADEVEAMYRAKVDVSASLEEIAVAFKRDLRRVRFWLAAHMAQLESEKLQALSLSARQANMSRHQQDLHRITELLKVELRPVSAYELGSTDQLMKPIAALELQDDPLFKCLEEHQPGATVWGEVEDWLRTRAALGEAARDFNLLIREEATRRTGLPVVEGLLEKHERQAGLTWRYISSVYGDSLERAANLVPSAKQYYVRESGALAVVSWGAEGLALADINETRSVIQVHEALRSDAHNTEQAVRLLAFEEEFRHRTRSVQASVDVMLLSGFTGGTCQICRSWI